mgnify:CR=1 FL=1
MHTESSGQHSASGLAVLCRVRLEFGRVVSAAEIATLDERQITELCVGMLRDLDSGEQQEVSLAELGVRQPGRMIGLSLVRFGMGLGVGFALATLLGLEGPARGVLIIPELVQALTKAQGGSAVFEKPVDYIGDKTLGNSAAYETYAQKHVHTVNIPGCNMPARVFVGQRQEGFAVRLGPFFDAVNYTLAQLTDPTQKNAFAADSIQDKNVTTLALEVHKSCLKGTGNDPVIGAWTTASMRQARLLDGSPKSGYQTTDKDGGAWVQVSRLGNPLINELVIGLRDKDKFNGSKPKDDLQFATYVTNPTLPALLGLVLTVDFLLVALH